MLHSASLLADLKSARRHKKVSQRQIADELAISGDAYRKMEKGQSPLSLERLIAICRYLKIDFRDLLDQNLDGKPAWEYESEIHRLNEGIQELKLERERLWTLVNKMMRLLDPNAADEVYRSLYRTI